MIKNIINLLKLKIENKKLDEEIKLMDQQDAIYEHQKAIEQYPEILEKLEKFQNMNIQERLKFLTNKDYCEMENLKGESLLIRHDNDNTILIKQIGVDSHECLCDGDTVAEISISYYNRNLIPKEHYK